MRRGATASNIVDCLFGPVVFAIGVANAWLVHPVPGVVCLLLALVYFPPATAALDRRPGIAVPLALKLVLGLAVAWFTLGVSDLGDMLDG